VSPSASPTGALGLELRQRQRALSTTSSTFRDPSIDPAEEREKRRKRREEKRAERAKKSTLKGEEYDSPLRSVIRWGSVNDLSGWGLGIGLGLVWILRMFVGVLGESMILST
jgi:hypothetical protein